MNVAVSGQVRHEQEDTAVVHIGGKGRFFGSLGHRLADGKLVEGSGFFAFEPGVLLTLLVDVVQMRGKICKFAGRAMIGDKLAAEASFTAMIADPPA